MNCARRSRRWRCSWKTCDATCRPAPARKSLAQLEAGVSRAQRLVDQLLKLSRQEAPVLEPAGPVDLHAQLHESMNALIALADQRNIDLGLVAATEGGAAAPTLRCAAGDLRSVLDNLIENALRYTPEGGVVDVRLVNEGGRTAVEVVDTGPGIPPDQLARVFDRFFRVPGSQVRGSGLGLSIAQAAAQRCGLRITAAQSRGSQRPGCAHRGRLRRRANSQLSKP